MRNLLLASVTLAALLPASAPSLAQGFYFGPGGVVVDDGRRYRRSYDEYGEERRYRRVCARLRDACVNKDLYGEEGQGNCRRYRRTCGG
jgi:hypothetical protein